MEFYAYHGYYPEEQVTGGRYRVDVYLTTDCTGAAINDDLAGTINYEQVYGITGVVMQQPSKLIEHVAQRILDRIMEQCAAAVQVTVRVSKLNPPVKGLVKRVYVELMAER